MKLRKFERKHYQRWFGLEYFLLSIINILGILIMKVLDYGFEIAKVLRELRGKEKAAV